MCGIVGVYNYKQGRLPEAGIRQAIDKLRHRGPDNQDYYIDEYLMLGHTRLSLLDLNPRSNQPFWDSSRNYCLIYNGEIYNYHALREQLKKDGVKFSTSSDTEVLLYSLIYFGIEKTLQRIEGMYAFAFYNTKDRSLVLARDKFGIKPLYYTEYQGKFFFVSEIKGLQPWCTLEPNPFSIASYLCNGGGPTTGTTFFKGIRCLPPGYKLLVRPDKKPIIDQYFCLSHTWNSELRRQYSNFKTERLIDILEESLLESVRLMLVADAPVGALCSGGLDSSLIMAMAKKFHNNLAIFHANVTGPKSEYQAAKQLADYLSLDLQKVDVTDIDFLMHMPEVIYHYGYPFSYHPNSVPFLLVSKLVRSHGVKAVLSGEGADECFHGYPWLIFDLIGKLKKYYRCPVKSITDFINELKKGGRSPVTEKQMTQQLFGCFEKEIESDELRENLLNNDSENLKRQDFITLEQLGYHLRTLLHRNDCLGMAASIEARFPFLHSDIIKIATNLPYRYKVAFTPTNINPRHIFLTDKWILRKVASRYIPPELFKRRKMGFPVDAPHRMEIPCSFFYGSWVQEFFELSQKQLEYLFENCSQNMKIRFLHLDVWGKIYFAMEEIENIAQKLVQSIKIQTK